MYSDAIGMPRVVVLGISLDLYGKVLPEYYDRQREQLKRFVAEFDGRMAVEKGVFCHRPEQVASAIHAAESAAADALLLVPLSYTTSMTTVPALLETNLPVLVWNTQEATEIRDDYGFDDLLMNHVPQGTQDITSVLVARGKRFGMVSGHYRDESALAELADWCCAARAARAAKRSRVGLMGGAFPGMGDFGVDLTRMELEWGPRVVPVSVARLLNEREAVSESEVRAEMMANRERYEFAPDVTDEIHAMSVRLGAALRKIAEAEELDAFTMNFLDLIEEKRLGTLPFLGINKLVGEGLGVSGEGDVKTAANMAQLRRLCGIANFTEIYTIDYKADRMMMTHMQECNPALARKDRKVRIVKKDFWAPGIAPYAGMHFTLEPGDVTLAALAGNPDGALSYLVYETRIRDMGPLPNFDIPHWITELDEPAGEFLTRYSEKGGPHHLAAVPGRMAGRIEKLARLQGAECRWI